MKKYYNFNPIPSLPTAGKALYRWLAYGLSLLVCLAYGQAQAQNVQYDWSAVPTTVVPINNILATRTDVSGNTYIVGAFAATYTFGSTTLVPTACGFCTNAFIAKIDAGGNYAWAKAWTVPNGGFEEVIMRRVVVDASGNVYIGGDFQAVNQDFDPGPGTQLLSNTGNYTPFILKLNSAGDFVWVKTIDGGGNNTLNDLKLDASGNIYAVGQFAGTNVDFDPGVGTVYRDTPGSFDFDGYTLKLDSSGNFVWVNVVGNNGVANGDVTNFLTIDATGNVYAMGDFSVTVDFDNGAGVANLTASGTETFLVKYNAMGDYVWAKQGVVYPNSIASDASGVYMTGSMTGTVDFDPSGAVFNLSGTTQDIFVSKLDASGNFAWAQKLGGTVGGQNDVGNYITTDANNNVYIVGYFKGINVDFDAGAGSSLLSSTSTSNDVFVLKLSSAGNFTWVKQVGGTGDDSGSFIIVDGSGNIYYSGDFVGTVDLNPDAGVANFTRASSTTFTTKLKSPTPTITSFTPTSGIAGTSVAITGTNFNAAYNKNVVYVGGMKVNPTAGSATSLTFTIPLGASSVSPIVVQDEVTGKQASSLNSTTPLFIITTSPTLTVNANTYNTKSITVGNSPVATAVGDFNNDGKPDIAVVNQTSENISIRLGDGAGNFSNTATLATGTTSVTYAIKTGDLNNDGKLDLIVANFGLNNVRAFLGDGTGNFPTAYNTSVGANPTDVALADFNADGILDIATAHTNGDNIFVKFGNGTGNFAGSVVIGTFNDAQSLAVGDFDADGDIDIACGGPNVTNNLLVVTNTGSGSFDAPAISTIFANAVESMTSGHFNADTDIDILIGFANGEVRLFTGSAGATFVAGTINDHTNPVRGITVADFNGDGRMDYLSSHGSAGDKLVMALGNGFGVFTNIITIPFNGAFGASSADFNLDGKADIVATDFGGTTTRVLLYSPIPTISSFSPTNGGIGTSVTITGADFNAVPSNNYVYFGAIRVTPTAGSTTSLTVTVPAGATSVAPIIVQDKISGKQASSIASITPRFTVTNSPALAITGTSYAKTDYVVINSLFAVTTADFNHDGITDLATARFGAGGNNVHTLLGTGGGTFGSPTVSTNGTSASAISTGDFNNDGKIDLVVSNYGSSNIGIFLGMGDGTFGAVTTFPTVTNPYGLAVADFNQDGNADVAVVDVTDFVRVLLGNGNGTLGAATSFTATTGAGTTGVAVGDFNNDGYVDLISANKDTDNISLLLGAGDGTFGAATTFAVGDLPYAVVVGDFNKDGNNDVAVANNGTTDNVSVLIGDGTGSFSGATNFAVGLDPHFIAVGDFNGDDKMDLATANDNASDVSILLGDGAGNFAPTINLGTGNAKGISVGDFNNDGKADLVTASAPNARIYLYAPPFSATSATNITTTSFTANWTAVDGATDYELQESTDNSSFSPIYTGTALFYSVTGLSAGDIRYYRVRYSTDNQTSWSSPSNVKMTSTILPAGSGNMLRFDGSGDNKVRVNDNSAFNFTSANDFTLEAWIKIGSTSTDMDIMSNTDGSNGYSLSVNTSGKLGVVYNTTGEFSGTTPLLLNQWIHVAAVFTSSGSFRTYINGMLEGSGSSIVISASTKELTIGSQPESGNPFNGDIDEVKIWNTARTEAQIRTSMCSKLVGTESGLVGYFRFDENIDTVVENKASLSNTDGTIVSASMPAWATSSAPLGDVSAYTYTVASGVTLTNTDAITASDITGSPDAVHLYKVNATLTGTTQPANYASLYNDRYWGMFFVGGTSPQATLAYNYSANTTVDVANALRFAQRDNNADLTWASMGGIQNRSSKKLTHRETNAGEYILAERNAIITNYKDGGTILTFDNTNTGYVQMPRYVDGDFTIEFWMRPTTLGLSGVSWEVGRGLVTANKIGTDNDFGITLRDAQIAFGAGNTSLFSTTTIQVGKWYHIATTRNGTTGELKLYIDGKEEATSIGTTNPLTDATNIHIGKLFSGGNYFNGSIDELRIWNTALDENTIKDWVNLRAQDQHPNFANLEAYYRFDENTGTLAEDLVNGNDATLTGGVTWADANMPLGDGAVSRLIVPSTSGTVSVFPEAGVTMNFGTITPDGEVVATRIDGEPESYPAVAGMSFMNAYWVIRNYGTNQTFSALPEITFEVPAGNTISAADLANPFNIKLYKRPDNAIGSTVGVGNWQAVASATGFGSVRFGGDCCSGGGGGTSIEDYSQFVIGSASSPLPITLVGFTGERVETTEEVRLAWSTASEINNKGFEVEMSADGLAYTKIAFVEGKGNSTTIQAYSHTTIQPNEAYYRLKQVDFNGTFSYSPVVFVTGMVGKDFVRVYPNPAKEQITIALGNVPASEVLKATIFNANGKRVWKGTGKLDELQNALNQQFGSWKTGVYILQIQTNKRTLQTKIVKE